MSWKLAKEILENSVVRELDSPFIGEDWLDKLEKANCKDGHRLGLCIAIDLVSGAIPPEDFIGIVNMIDKNEPCGRNAFAKAIAKHPRRTQFTCASRLRTGEEEEDSYVRVLSISDFITYYRKDRSLSPDDIATTRSEYFSEYAPDDLSDISEWWSGTGGVVWVMSRDQYDELARKHDGDALASLLNDALGLGKEPSMDYDDGRELVGVRYPSDSRITARQPSTLDADWEKFGWYFVSYGEDDGWGRTVSSSGDEKSLKERVHTEFKGLTEGYQGFPIGRILYSKHDRERLLQEAEVRLQSMNRASAPSQTHDES